MHASKSAVGAVPVFWTLNSKTADPDMVETFTLSPSVTALSFRNVLNTGFLFAASFSASSRLESVVGTR